MTKVNEEDYGQPLWSGEPFQPEALEVQTDGVRENAWAFSLHDRQGQEYHFYLSRPEFGSQQATAVAYLSILGASVMVDVLHIAEPDKYGPQPQTEDEARAWLKTFTDAWQARGDQFSERGPIVVEPYKG